MPPLAHVARRNAGKAAWPYACEIISALHESSTMTAHLIS